MPQPKPAPTMGKVIGASQGRAVPFTKRPAVAPNVAPKTAPTPTSTSTSTGPKGLAGHLWRNKVGYGLAAAGTYAAYRGVKGLVEAANGKRREDQD
jgi:hypothetical protein